MKTFFRTVLVIAAILSVLIISPGWAASTIKVMGVGITTQTRDLLIKEFEKTNPGVKVEMDVIPWTDYYPKLLSNIRAGQYDVYYIPQLLPLTYNESYLLPLEKLAKKDPEYLKQFVQSTLQNGYRPDTKGNIHLYAVPFDTDARYLGFDKTIFDAYGVPYPKANGKFNIRDLKTIALKMTGNTTKLGQTYGLALRVSAMDYYFPAFMGSLGQPAFDYRFGSKNVYFNTPAAKETLQIMVDLVKAGAAGPEALTGTTCPIQFGKDQNPYAMNFMGYSEIITNVFSNRSRFGFTALPENPKTHQCGPDLFHGWGIDKRSTNQAEAWQWIKFTSTDPAQFIVFQNINMPVVKRWNDWTITHPVLSPSKPVSIQSISELNVVNAQFLKSIPVRVDNWAKVRSIIREEVGNALAGTKTVDQALADMQSKSIEAMNDPMWTW